MIAILFAAAVAASAVPQVNRPAAGDNPDLNCLAGFDTLSEQVLQQPQVREVDSGSPSLVAYLAPQDRSIYTITRKGHPAYPSIVREHVGGGGAGVSVQMLACAYGQPAAVKTFMQFMNERNHEMQRLVWAGKSPFDVAQGVPNPGQ